MLRRLTYPSQKRLLKRDVAWLDLFIYVLNLVPMMLLAQVIIGASMPEAFIVLVLGAILGGFALLIRALTTEDGP